MQSEEDTADKRIPLEFANLLPVNVVGAGLTIQFFYNNMRRMGNSLKSDPDMSIPAIVLKETFKMFRSGLLQTVKRMLRSFPWQSKQSKIDQRTLGEPWSEWGWQKRPTLLHKEHEPIQTTAGSLS